MKKSMARCIACVLILSVFIQGCAFNKNYSTITIDNSDSIAEVIKSTMKNRSASVLITFSAYTLDRSSIESIVAELVEEAFYESDDPKGGDYLRYQYSGYEIKHTAEKKLFKYNYKVRIIPEYYTSKEQEDELDQRVDDIILGLNITEDMSDEAKVRAVHDYICENVSYDTVHKHTPGSGHIQSTAYGALVYNTALCQGYAVATYRLLKELGIDNRIVTGDATVSLTTERHAWNIVLVDGAYYNLDVTLDDVNGSLSYYLKSDEDFAVDHVRDQKYMSDDFCSCYPVSKESYNFEEY